MEIVGIDKDKVLAISKIKKEDKWIEDYRLKSFGFFEKIDMPAFGPKLDLDFKVVPLIFKSSIVIHGIFPVKLLGLSLPGTIQSQTSITGLTFHAIGFRTGSPNISINFDLTNSSKASICSFLLFIKI